LIGLRLLDVFGPRLYVGPLVGKIMNLSIPTKKNLSFST